MGGWLAGPTAFCDIKANSAQLKLELGLSLAIYEIKFYFLYTFSKGNATITLDDVCCMV